MTRMRFLLAAVMAAALLAGLSAAGAPAAASVATDHGPRCFAGDVRGLAIAQARRNLAAFGCRRGTAKDGHHYVIRTRCGAATRRGTVVAQRPVDILLKKRQRLVVFVGVAGTSEGCPADTDPYSVTGVFDGPYLGAFTTTSAPSEFLPEGSVFPGLAFTVAYGVISGDVTGTLNGLGVSTDAAITIDGRACRPVSVLRFVASVSGQAVASGDMVCSGDPALTGTFDAAKQ
ncbi:MAG: hypothetical protein Q8M17_15425 [Actinomycetota bacterium]|nr:hypothetical protein [Actinomycetota bacterium]